MCYTLFTLFSMFNTVHTVACVPIYIVGEGYLAEFLFVSSFVVNPLNIEQILKKSFEILFVSILAVGILSAHHGLQNSVWSKSMTLFLTKCFRK